LDEAADVFPLVLVEEACCGLAGLELTVVDFFAAAASCALAAVKTHPSNKATTALNHAFRIPTGLLTSTQID